MGVRIQELPETTGINKEDLLIVEDGQGTKKGTVQQLDEALGVSQLKEDLVEISEDVSQMITYEQTEQKFIASGNLISDNWDSTGVGGYYDGNGNYIENPSYRWFRIDGVREDYSLYTNNLTGVCFIHVFSGEPSSSTFVRRYSSVDSSLPTEGNAVTIQSGYIVIVQNTDSSGIKIICDNKSEYVFGYKLGEIEEIAKSSTKMAEQANTKAEQANTKAEQAVEIAGSIEPIVDRTKELKITKSMMQFIGNKYPSGTGALYDNDGYWGYTYVIPEDGDFYVKNLGNSSFGYLAIYNNSVADGNLAMDRESGNTFATRNLSKGQIVFISYALTTTEESNVQGGNITYTYHYTERPTMFMREMKVAWFGDSISQLQLLPHRVAEYIGCVVEDCSFAGAPLTYGAEAYQGTGFMSLSSQIISGDFSELENALSKQTSITEDKRANADRLEALNFNTITDIVVMAGTNDLNNDYVATSTDLTKFKNGMRTAIENILDNFPHICMRFISNPYRGDITVDRHGNSLADFVNAEKEVCEEYNIPYYDLLHKCGINSHNVGYYLMNDKLHQNENGDILLAQKCAKWLMSH